MLKIYGFGVSTWSNRVRFTANKLGVPYEYVSVNLVKGEAQTEEYLAIHPAGKVPAMDDDGFRLFESGAIAKYLAAKMASELYPSGLKERAVVDQWSDFVALHVAKAMERVLFNRIIFQVLNAEKDERSLQEGLSFLDRFLPIVDSQLGRSSYLASDSLTLADMTLLAWLDPVELCEIDLSKYSNITRWRNQLKQEDFYKACHSDYREAFHALAA